MSRKWRIAESLKVFLKVSGKCRIRALEGRKGAFSGNVRKIDQRFSDSQICIERASDSQEFVQ